MIKPELMRKKSLLFYLSFLILSSSLFAQTPIDTVTFRFIPDASTFKVRCMAQKIIGTDTTDFEIADTVGAAYTFDWGGTKEPNKDGLFFATYEFTDTGNYNFTLSVVEQSTAKTFTEAKTLRVRDFISIPNVFTPNEDGVNDLFIVRSNGIDELEMIIFSKTGTKVFEQKAPIIVWDGRNASGSRVSQGLYYYILKTPAAEAQKGFVYVIYDPGDL